MTATNIVKTAGVALFIFNSEKKNYYNLAVSTFCRHFSKMYTLEFYSLTIKMHVEKCLCSYNQTLYSSCAPCNSTGTFPTKSARGRGRTSWSNPSTQHTVKEMKFWMIEILSFAWGPKRNSNLVGPPLQRGMAPKRGSLMQSKRRRCRSVICFRRHGLQKFTTSVRK